MIRIWVLKETKKQYMPPKSIFIVRQIGKFVTIWSYTWTFLGSTILLVYEDGPADCLKDALCLLFVLTAHKDIVMDKDYKIHEIFLKDMINALESTKQVDKDYSRPYGNPNTTAEYL